MAPMNVCVKIRGELAIGRIFAPHTCMREVRLDPDHDAVMRIGGKAPGGGPHSLRRHCVPCHVPVPATSDRQSAVRPERQRERRRGKKMLFPGALACRTQDDALQCLASRYKAPEPDQQLACQRDDHRLARAYTAIGSAGLVPLRQCALFLKPQEPPGELDHAAISSLRASATIIVLRVPTRLSAVRAWYHCASALSF